MAQPDIASLTVAREYLAEMVIDPEGGAAYVPLFERLEREIEAIEARQNAVDRARRLIADRVAA